MIKILFVCYGNICRSTMAEFVMRDLVEKAGLGDAFRIESAATHDDEIGSPVHAGTVEILDRLGIDCSGKRARRLTPDDGRIFDLIVGMDRANMRDIRRIVGPKAPARLFKLLEFVGSDRDVADPWYTGDFEATYSDVRLGCESILREIARGSRLR